MIHLLESNNKKSKFFQIKETLKNENGVISISGLSESGSAPIISFIATSSKRQCLIMTSSYSKAKALYDDMKFFTEKEVFLFPNEEKIFLNYDAKSYGNLEEKIRAISNIISEKDCIIIGSVNSILKKLPPKEEYLKNILDLRIGADIELSNLKKKLTIMGFERAEIVEAKGQFSIRGGIVDIFPINDKTPIRIEFFDTEIDSIRSFDIDSQRSISSLEEIKIYPCQLMIYDEAVSEKAKENIEKLYEEQICVLDKVKQEKLRDKKNRLLGFIETFTNHQALENYIHYFYKEMSCVADYFSKNSVLVLADEVRIRERISSFEKEQEEDFKDLIERGEIVPQDYEIFIKEENLEAVIKEKLTYTLDPFQGEINVETKQIPSFYNKMDMFLEEIRKYEKEKYKVYIICSTEERITNIKGFLERNHVFEGKVSFYLGNLSHGIEFIEEKIAFISDSDIFSNIKAKKTRAQRKDAKPIKAFTDIRQGDYVVHENHGIGKFEGIKQLEIQGIKTDYLQINYAGNDVLYVPVEQMDMVQKYISADSITPKINKMGSPDWQKTKARVKAAIESMARELLEMNAIRSAIKGYAFASDSVWQEEFEDSFPYQETDDQLRSVREIKKDMEKELPMDRLLCGDVGYGKTEVAARAIFKCIADGKQAAILVPTTILCNQHYHTLKERIEKFPFKVEMLSRFRSEKQQNEIIKKLKKGEIDVVVGTHRLVSKDIEFKDLGLLIIDEEQRFGVSHKEAVKILRKNVDVLTLSATPIPRTLHMSLIGVRDMSLIEEPPEERYPVQTYVMEQDNSLMRDVILREIERGGQVFVVYNKVRGIKSFAAELTNLIPEARIAVGHGQMAERQLENIIIDFMNKETDVLVCTTIIETGIDIQNANTMIIIDADRFGLSQLYQLRGRVGRSNKIAFTYLFYQKNKTLTEVAEKRLKAIKEFTEFGSGFKIAMRDLEIRGAGNLIGTEQHGHMTLIGYELYCKLLEETVKKLTTEGGVELERVEERETSVEFETVGGYIPDNYINNEVIKVEIYKKIAAVKNEIDREEIIDELLDRFSEIPRDTQNLIEISLIRAIGQSLGAEMIKERNGVLTIDFYEKNSLKAEMFGNLMGKYGSKVLISGKTKPKISYTISKRLNCLPEIAQFMKNFYLQE